MFKTIKGYIKRIQSIFNRDKNYKSKPSEYGTCEVTYVDGIIIDNDYIQSNIVISIIHDNGTDAIMDLAYFITLCAEIGLRVINDPDSKGNGVYVFGSPYQFAYLIIRYETAKSDNHIFSLVYNLCKEIEAIAYVLERSKSEDGFVDVDYYPYMQDNVQFSSSKPVWVMDSNKEGEMIDDLIKVYLYDIDQDQLYSYYLSDLKFITTLQDDYLFIIDMIKEYGKDFTSNFNLKNGKNIITDNLLITNTDNDSYYEDIDEIIE